MEVQGTHVNSETIVEMKIKTNMKSEIADVSKFADLIMKTCLWSMISI